MAAHIPQLVAAEHRTGHGYARMTVAHLAGVDTPSAVDAFSQITDQDFSHSALARPAIGVAPHAVDGIDDPFLDMLDIDLALIMVVAVVAGIFRV